MRLSRGYPQAYRLALVLVLMLNASACGVPARTSLDQRQSDDLNRARQQATSAAAAWVTAVSDCPSVPPALSRCGDQAYHQLGVAEAMAAYIQVIAKTEKDVRGNCNTKLQAVRQGGQASAKALDRFHRDITNMDLATMAADLAAINADNAAIKTTTEQEDAAWRAAVDACANLGF